MQRRALSWLGPRGPRPTAGVMDGGSAAGAPPPARLVSRHSKRAELCGGLSVTRCREAVQSLMERDGQREGAREGASPQVRRADQGGVRTPRSRAGVFPVSS